MSASEPPPTAAAALAVSRHEWEPSAPWSSHAGHSYNASCMVCQGNIPAILAVAAPVLLAEHEKRDRAELALIHAAMVWRIARRTEVDGMTYVRACRALDQAVAALIGELDGEPVAPPTDEELEEGRDLVRRAKEYSAKHGGGAAVDKILARGSRPADSGGGCTCAKAEIAESLAGEPVTSHVVAERDRRCPVHGKPRHAGADSGEAS